MVNSFVSPQHCPSLLPLEEGDVINLNVILKSTRFGVLLQTIQLPLLGIFGWKIRITSDLFVSPCNFFNIVNTFGQQTRYHGVNILHISGHLHLHREVDKARIAKDCRLVLSLNANLLHVPAAVRVVVVVTRAQVHPGAVRVPSPCAVRTVLEELSVQVGVEGDGPGSLGWLGGVHGHLFQHVVGKVAHDIGVGDVGAKLRCLPLKSNQ